MTDKSETPYSLGYRQGYDDYSYENPYEYGSEEYNDFNLGYWDGSNDC
jgi:hypothetical protein